MKRYRILMMLAAALCLTVAAACRSAGETAASPGAERSAAPDAAASPLVILERTTPEAGASPTVPLERSAAPEAEASPAAPAEGTRTPDATPIPGQSASQGAGLDDAPQTTPKPAGTVPAATESAPAASPAATDAPQSHTEAVMTRESVETAAIQRLNFWLYTPENAVGNMPLIVYLHGGSFKGDDLSLLIQSGFPQYLYDGQLGSVPAYVVIPQLPSDIKGWAEAAGPLRELIRFMEESRHIDAGRVSLTGHSMGGTGVWSVAAGSPSLFSCIAPLSGSVRSTEKNREALKDLPVWAFVGSADTIVDPQASIRFIEELDRLGADASLTVWEGASHFDVPRLTYLDESTDIIGWLLSHSR
ncbi:MAG: dienelactone hydrolase family protein [Clostridia bacterium]|nr:dienelactone hydrolase family protein [Clostridia bacterium]